MIDLKVTDFTKYPGPRYKELGPNSGEEFREDFLVKALEQDPEVRINLDGVLGYGSSFLEEIFGGLVRAMPSHPANTSPNNKPLVKHQFLTLPMIEFLIDHLISFDDPFVVEEIKIYIDKQVKELQAR